MSMDVYMTHIWFLNIWKYTQCQSLEIYKLKPHWFLKIYQKWQKSDDKTVGGPGDTGLLPPTLLLEAEIVIAPAESNLATSVHIRDAFTLWPSKNFTCRSLPSA